MDVLLPAQCLLLMSLTRAVVEAPLADQQKPVVITREAIRVPLARDLTFVFYKAVRERADRLPVCVILREFDRVWRFYRLCSSQNHFHINFDGREENKIMTTQMITRARITEPDLGVVRIYRKWMALKNSWDLLSFFTLFKEKPKPEMQIWTWKIISGWQRSLFIC